MGRGGTQINPFVHGVPTRGGERPDRVSDRAAGLDDERAAKQLGRLHGEYLANRKLSRAGEETLEVLFEHAFYRELRGRGMLRGTDAEIAAERAWLRGRATADLRRFFGLARPTVIENLRYWMLAEAYRSARPEHGIAELLPNVVVMRKFAAGPLSAAQARDALLQTLPEERRAGETFPVVEESLRSLLRVERGNEEEVLATAFAAYGEFYRDIELKPDTAALRAEILADAEEGVIFDDTTLFDAARNELCRAAVRRLGEQLGGRFSEQVASASGLISTEEFFAAEPPRELIETALRSTLARHWRGAAPSQAEFAGQTLRRLIELLPGSSDVWRPEGRYKALKATEKWI